VTAEEEKPSEELFTLTHSPCPLLIPERLSILRIVDRLTENVDNNKSKFLFQWGTRVLFCHPIWSPILILQVHGMILWLGRYMTMLLV